MTTIKIQVENCKGCPFFVTQNPYTTDGFDYMEDWICRMSNRIIQPSVEWHEIPKIKVPEWCEIKTDSILRTTI